MAKNPRGKYFSHLSRIYNHLDWYLQETFTSCAADQLTMAEIRAGVRDSTGVNVSKRTLLRYNTRQFSRYQTAPLECAGDDNYRMNQNYYGLLGDKVAEPRVGKPGRPRKHTDLI